MQHCVQGANNRLSNGIVPLQIVCEQVGSLGVPKRQVSIGLNETGLRSNLASCAHQRRGLVLTQDFEILNVTGMNVLIRLTKIK